jgi:hypothetical protein
LAHYIIETQKKKEKEMFYEVFLALLSVLRFVLETVATGAFLASVYLARNGEWGRRSTKTAWLAIGALVALLVLVVFFPS